MLGCRCGALCVRLLQSTNILAANSPKFEVRDAMAVETSGRRLDRDMLHDVGFMCIVTSHEAQLSSSSSKRNSKGVMLALANKRLSRVGSLGA